MSYTPTNWVTGDVVTAERLNKIENGIVNAPGFGISSVILTEETITTTDMGGIYGAQLTYSTFITADTLTVTFDGNEYSCPKVVGMENMAIYGGYDGDLGNPDFTDYPFAIATQNGAGNTVVTETDGEHSITIAAPTITTTSDFDTAVNMAVIIPEPEEPETISVGDVLPYITTRYIDFYEGTQQIKASKVVAMMNGTYTETKGSETLSFPAMNVIYRFMDQEVDSQTGNVTNTHYSYYSPTVYNGANNSHKIMLHRFMGDFGYECYEHDDTTITRYIDSTALESIEKNFSRTRTIDFIGAGVNNNVPSSQNIIPLLEGSATNWTLPTIKYNIIYRYYESYYSKCSYYAPIEWSGSTSNNYIILQRYAGTVGEAYYKQAGTTFTAYTPT